MSVQKTFVAEFNLSFKSLCSLFEGSIFSHPDLNKIEYISGLSIDSRYVKNSQIFVAIVGEKLNGHDFVEEAKSNGAVCAIVNREELKLNLDQLIDENFFLIKVKDTIAALHHISLHHRNNISSEIISITGSNGKTTSKEMVASVLEKTFSQSEVHSTYGNQNNHIGVPLNLLRITPKTKKSVIEIGMNNFGEVKMLSKLVKPKIVLITNAQREHQEYLGSVEASARENGSVILNLQQHGYAIFPEDKCYEHIWRDYAQEVGSNVITFELCTDSSNIAEADSTNKVLGKIKSHNPLIVSVKINNSEEFQINLKGFGEHFAQNALSVIAVGYALKIPRTSLMKSLEEFKPVSGRGNQYILKNGSLLIDDTYNANPESAKAAIDVLAERTCQRILILGDMAELGSEAKRLHREVGEHAARSGIEELLSLGDFSRHASEIFGGKHFDKLDELIVYLKSLGSSNQVTFLVKGSRSSAMERVAEYLERRKKNASVQ